MSLPPLPEEAPDSIAPLDAAAAAPLPPPALPVSPGDTPAPADSPGSLTPEGAVTTDGPPPIPPIPVIPPIPPLPPDSRQAPPHGSLEADTVNGSSTAVAEAASTTAAVIAAVAMRPRWSYWWDEFMAWVRVFTSAAVYATLIVTFLFQVARVDGQSMAPTLEDRDRLIVNKLAYRLGEPQRGDIVMLYYPLDPDKSYVKRVIAEEGDMVRVVEGQVFVNDVPLPDDQIPPEYRSHDDWGPQVIPEGYYFVMGDHRNNSSDSRHWGFVPKKYIIGRVQVRWWPIPTATIF